MKPLHQYDELFIRNRLPREVRNIMNKHGASSQDSLAQASPANLFLAGGFIRSVIAREQINDVDLFASDKALANDVANELADKFHSRVYESDNAYTVRAKPYTLQVIYRWTFPSPEQCVESFDYTIARAALWSVQHVDVNGNPTHCTWKSIADDDFYSDLAAKRLVYRSPIREEEAGGSLLRLLKFYGRGYRVPLDSLAAVMARLVVKVDCEAIAKSVTLDNIDGDGNSREKQTAKVLLGLLHEVDPNSVTNDPAYITKEEIDE